MKIFVTQAFPTSPDPFYMLTTDDDRIIIIDDTYWYYSSIAEMVLHGNIFNLKITSTKIYDETVGPKEVVKFKSLQTFAEEYPELLI